MNIRKYLCGHIGSILFQTFIKGQQDKYEQGCMSLFYPVSREALNAYYLLKKNFMLVVAIIVKKGKKVHG